MTMRIVIVSAACLLALTGCHSRRGEDNGGVPGDVDSHEPFSAISEMDTLHFVGTEPFWGGEARATTLLYTTPGKPGGTKIVVKRFGGRNGLGLSGDLDGKALDMTVTPGTCSDGMSDRQFPYTVTLRIGEEVRQGCAWTDKQRFREGSAPAK